MQIKFHLAIYLYIYEYMGYLSLAGREKNLHMFKSNFFSFSFLHLLESLEYHPSPMPIEHEEVGRYMAAYRETHYKMNYAVQRVYMNDEKFVLDDVRKRYPDLFREVLDER